MITLAVACRNKRDIHQWETYSKRFSIRKQNRKSYAIHSSLFTKKG